MIDLKVNKNWFPYGHGQYFILVEGNGEGGGGGNRQNAQIFVAGSLLLESSFLRFCLYKRFGGGGGWQGCFDAQKKEGSRREKLLCYCML